MPKSSAAICSARVTAVDVDPYLNSAAGDRLSELGHRPELITADVTGPLPDARRRLVGAGRGARW